MSVSDPIFQPLRFRTLELPNRVLRSNIAGRLDHYDGSGTQARINWELKFARNGVGGDLVVVPEIVEPQRVEAGDQMRRIAEVILLVAGVLAAARGL